MSFPSIAAALTEDDGNGSDFSDADHHDEGLPMEVSLRLQAKGSLAAPESPRSKTTEAAEAKLAVAKAKLDAARLERSRSQLVDATAAAAPDDGGAAAGGPAADGADGAAADDDAAADEAPSAADEASSAADSPAAASSDDAAAADDGDGGDAAADGAPRRLRFAIDGDELLGDERTDMLLEQVSNLSENFTADSPRLVDTPTARPKKRKSLAAKALKKAKNGIRHSANAAKEAVTKKAVVARHFKPKLVLGAGAFGAARERSDSTSLQVPRAIVPEQGSTRRERPERSSPVQEGAETSGP